MDDASSDERPDDVLAVRLRSHKAGALGEVYVRYGSMVYAFAFRLCGQRTLAEDLTQEVFAKLAASPPKEGAPLRPWLLRITRNLFVDHRRRRTLDIDRMRDLSLWPSSPQPSPAEALDTAAKLGRVGVALQEIPLPLREAIVLVCMEGLSASETGDVLGVSAETVRQRVSRGRAILRKQLEKS